MKHVVALAVLLHYFAVACEMTGGNSIAMFSVIAICSIIYVISNKPEEKI
jgi:hypothetical protein